MLEKVELTLIIMLSKTKKVITTPPPVLCSVASYKLFYSTMWSIETLSLLFVPPAKGGGMEIIMLFNSLDFLIFFPIVVLGYFILPKKLKNIWLLIGSYYFYMQWSYKYIVLILFSTAITYVSGLVLEYIKSLEIADEEKVRKKKWMVLFSVGINLMMLFYFKYFNFAIDSVNELLTVSGISSRVPNLDITLPVGISFYVFQALSYTIDVYRNEIPAERNFFKYALFVSFFPQLVAGPIERSKNLLNQLEDYNKFDFERAKSGFLLMLWGFFLKIVLADRIAVFVDSIYGDIVKYGGFYLIVASLLFAVQIYCDFYGYSTIAMGAAKVLGINLMENFESPYLAKSVSEFWRRWHVSLSSWFRDYVYIPLGGNRKGTIRKYLNILIVFLLSGLWHGADFSYVIWGGLNGLYQVAGNMIKPLKNLIIQKLNINRELEGYKVLSIVTTFILVNITWIFFRATNFSEAMNVIDSILNVWNPWILFDGSLYKCGLNQKNFNVMLISIGVLIIADICKMRKIRISEIVEKQDYWCQAVIISFVLIVIFIFGKYGTAYDASKFIYFQF